MPRRYEYSYQPEAQRVPKQDSTDQRKRCCGDCCIVGCGSMVASCLVLTVLVFAVVVGYILRDVCTKSAEPLASLPPKEYPIVSTYHSRMTTSTVCLKSCVDLTSAMMENC